MKSPAEMGFKRSWVYETMVETLGGHCAPMGVSTDDGIRLRLLVYNNTKTCGNIKKEGKLRVYFSNDSLALAEALESRRINAASTTGFIDLRVVGERELGGRTEFVCEVSGGEVDNVSLVNRAEGLLTELLVESTKPGRDETLMKKYAEKIRKVAPASEHAKAAEKITRKLR